MSRTLPPFDPENPPGGLFVSFRAVAFDELDALWVLHHSRVVAHAERLQQAFFDQVMQPAAFDPARYPDLYVVVRDIRIRYREPMRGVAPYLGCLWVRRVREAGLVTAVEFRDPTGERVYCQGERTVCRLDTETHRPVSWTTGFRVRYEEWGRLASAAGLP